jgi:hypothetical protein
MDQVALPAIPGREVSASCGCALVLVAERMVTRTGKYVWSNTVVHVPCREEGHREKMQAAIEAVGHVHDFEPVIARFEED